MGKKWKICKSEIIIKSPWITFRKDKCETPKKISVPEYYTWEKRDCVIVFPLKKNDNVILIEQYRHGVKKVCIDFPGGTIEKRKTVIQAANEKLIAEVGYQSDKIIEIAAYDMDSSYSNQRVHFVIAFDCQKVLTQKSSLEEIETFLIPIKKLEKFIEEKMDCLLCSHLNYKALNYLNNI
jgi:8-oxo-dGTP pyrophosphatase MutT (NUDIX family)